MKKITVKSILKNQLPTHLQDKVFLYAEKVIHKANTINLYIKNENVIAFDSYAKTLGVHSIQELASLSPTLSWDTGEKPVLVSSGSFLWINEKLLITQRTSDTKYDPLAWTTPAGRCDDTPLRTALKETIEEIHIHSEDNKDKLWMPERAKNLIPDSIDVSLYPSTIKFPPSFQSKLTKVKTWLDDKLIEETQLWYLYNESSNTLEFRIPLTASITGCLTYTNPEFHTQTLAVNFRELKHMKVVPAVEQLLREITP